MILINHLPAARFSQLAQPSVGIYRDRIFAHLQHGQVGERISVSGDDPAVLKSCADGRIASQLAPVVSVPSRSDTIRHIIDEVPLYKVKMMLAILFINTTIKSGMDFKLIMIMQPLLTLLQYLRSR
jgi:hypothetical protein